MTGLNINNLDEIVSYMISKKEGGFSRIGRANEDFCGRFVFDLFGQTYTLLLVLDGHGCPSKSKDIENMVVNLTAKYFPAILFEELRDNYDIIADKAIIQAHLKLQSYFSEFPDMISAGTCTGGALIYDNICIAFNLGDISVIHLETDGNHSELSKAHNACDPEELERLKGFDVRIFPDGRIYSGFTGIMVSGALGDTHLSFLQRTPHIAITELRQGDKIIVTSDGVIGGKKYGFTVEEVVNIVKNYQGEKIDEEIVSETIKSLYRLGYFPGQIDDATAMVYSHSEFVLPESLRNFSDLVKENNERCQKKLEFLLQNFDEKTLRETALEWLKNYNIHDENDSEWVSDAQWGWTGEKIDIELIKYWGTAVEHLLPTEYSQI